MTDYYSAYSPYAMLLIAATIVCIIIGALFCAYGVVKVGKGFLFWLVVITLYGFLCLPVMKFLALVSPSLKQQDIYLTLQRFDAFLVIILLLLIPTGIYNGGGRLKQYSAFSMVLLIHIACVFCLWKNTSCIWTDYLPVIDFCVFIIFLLLSGRTMFAELSPISIDNYMQELDDIILIFEKDGKLIDANGQAKKIWPFVHNGLPINEFLENLKAVTVSNKCIVKSSIKQYEEVSVSLTNGIRQYQYATTVERDKMGGIRATVLNFHDVTEISFLEKELARKNAELEKLNIQLEAFLDTAEKIVEEEQKVNAAKDIKEAVGNKIEKLLYELESIGICDKHEKLPGMIENCREVMAGVRLAMQKLMPDGGKDGKDD